MTNAKCFPYRSIAAIVCFLFSACNPPNEPAPLPAITVISPNGGEQYAVGDAMVVRWRANPDSVVALVLEISFNGGKKYFVINDMDAAGAGGGRDTSCTWIIPDSLADTYSNSMIPTPASDSCLVRVRDYNLPGNDRSDGFFSVAR